MVRVCSVMRCIYVTSNILQSGVSVSFFLFLSASHSSQRKRRNKKKLKHKYKQLFIYSYQMRVRETLSPYHSFARAPESSKTDIGVWNGSCKSEAKCCVHSIFPFYCSMPWLETSNFMIISCAFFFLFSCCFFSRKIWERVTKIR